MRVLNWFLIKATFAICLWVGLVHEVHGARNIGLFLAWLTIVCSWATFSAEVQKAMAEKGRSVPAWIDTSFDLAITGLLIWFGWWLTGAFYLLHWLVQQAAWQKAGSRAEKPLA